ncbi:DUF58 domain-containing protein [Pseudoroseomonas ludipueritiae]|nr:DUF58 domain-containing protein [Pseudoroseomonas ludipueritiae]MCG7360721.1 DUF58 domain-containing protein [Roseomonas sp. ACRSG]
MAETGTAPRATALRAEALGARLPPLVVAAERVAATVMQGVHGRRRAGQGDAFWQFRPYTPGDALNRLDWRQSAKSDRLFVRETEWEAAQSVALWRDAGETMRWSSGKLPQKVERAELLMLALASLLLRGGERVRLLGLRRAFAGRGVLPSLAEAMQRHMAPPGDESLPRHARAVLFGDFLQPLEETRAAVGALSARGVTGHLVQVLDPAEETLPYTGRIRFEALAAGEDPLLLPRVESVRALYAERLAAHRAGLATIAAAAGWRFTTHRTDAPPEAALLALWQALSPG